MAVVAVVVGSAWWSRSRSRAILEQWAVERDYEIKQANIPWFIWGPFTWTSTRGQVIYRLTIRDSEGRIYNGWARCGSYLWGLLSNEIEVIWD